MLSIKTCSQILNRKKKDLFSEKEVEEIRALFYELAEIDVEHYMRVQREKILKDEESNFNDQSKFR